MKQYYVEEVYIPINGTEATVALFPVDDETGMNAENVTVPIEKLKLADLEGKEVAEGEFVYYDSTNDFPFFYNDSK